MKQTAMQELRNDLVKAKEKSITALNDINNDILRKSCQEAVKLTIESIIERIDDELLKKEKQQIERCFMHGQYSVTIANGEQYYNETFKQH
jgi:flagellin-like hook-associated protein FlgL